MSETNFIRVRKKPGINDPSRRSFITTERDRNGSRGSPAQRSSILRSFDSLRLALLTLSLITNLGDVGTASAHTTDTQQQMMQQAHQPSNASPYDSPDFVLDESNIFG